MRFEMDRVVVAMAEGLEPSVTGLAAQAWYKNTVAPPSYL